MGKYDPLERLLRNSGKAELCLAFADIESILGSALPRSAYRWRAWWANDATGHSHARAWLTAGFETAEVDMEKETLIFRRARKTGNGLASPAAPLDGTGAGRKDDPKRHPAFGALKGTFHLEEGFDPANPAMPDWGETIDAQYGVERS